MTDYKKIVLLAAEIATIVENRDISGFQEFYSELNHLIRSTKKHFEKE